MAGLTVHRTQRAGARELLDEAFVVANGPPLWKRTCYRLWLQTPSEPRRVLLGQAGVTEGELARRIAQCRPMWRAEERAGVA